MVHLLPFKDCGGQDHALAACLDACSQEQGPQVLFHGAGADREFGGDFFVAAPLHQPIEHLLVTAGNFDLIEVQHGFLSVAVISNAVCPKLVQLVRQIFAHESNG